MKKKKIKTRHISLIVIVLFIIMNMAMCYWLFYNKGDYPKEMFIAIIPPITLDLFAIWKIGEKRWLENIIYQEIKI